MSDGTMDVPQLQAARADIVWLRDHLDTTQRGTAEERKMLYDLAAMMAALLGWEPDPDDEPPTLARVEAHGIAPGCKADRYVPRPERHDRASPLVGGGSNQGDQSWP